MTPMMVTPYSTMESTDASCLPDAPAVAAPGDHRQLGPEEELLFAIINNAIEDYLRGAAPAPMYRRALREQAEMYFLSPLTHWGSYLYCCRVLGLDPQYVWDHRAHWRRWYTGGGRAPGIASGQAAA
ncbi:MAG: hypothetical protein SF182_01625 [Deltaproteobacteria bacterium]|nr:hypothetical protein [Deltaproteobacteria bacterium]